MKKIYFLISMLMFTVVVLSQNIAISDDNVYTADPSAMLDVKSTDKGMLVPRLTAVQRTAIISPATGLLVFDTNDNLFYFYNGTLWVKIDDSVNFWSLNGNSGTVDGTNFIGTTDNVPLNFRVNNEKSGRIDPIHNNAFYGYESGKDLTTGDFNTAYGNQTMYSSTTAIGNTAVGNSAMYLNTTGYHNTVIGRDALYFNIDGYDNTANGVSALYRNVSGYRNTAIGIFALFNNSTGSNNTASGINSISGNTTGNYNTAFGYYTMSGNVAGSNGTAIGTNAMLYANNTATPFINYNVAIGFEALRGSTTPAANTGNYNTAIGYQALWSNTTGSQNTAYGFSSLKSNSTGIMNNAYGQQALEFNTTGSYNTSIGYGSSWTNTTGSFNIAIGHGALFYNSAGSNVTAIGVNAMQYANNTVIPFTNYNVAVGFEALRGSTTPAVNTGNFNTAIGYQTLWNNTTGYNNISIGHQSLYYNTLGSNNTAMGFEVLKANTTGQTNVANGGYALTSNTTGSGNTAMGFGALYKNTTGNQNTAIGYDALYYNSIGNCNTTIGDRALHFNTSGSWNTAYGLNSMQHNTTGNYNTAIGLESGFNNTTGSSNVFIGYRAGYNETGSNKLYIANSETNPPLIFGNFSTGKVGIGTTNPQAMLQITNTIDNTDHSLRIGANAGTAYGLIKYDQSDDNFDFSANSVFTGAVSGFRFFTAGNGSPRLVINRFGNVGIGTITPSAKLHIGGGTRFTVADVGSIFLQSGNGIGSARDWKIYVQMPDGDLVFRDMGFDNLNNGMAYDAMVIKFGTGYVGVGTNNPAKSLHVTTTTDDWGARIDGFNGGGSANGGVVIGSRADNKGAINGITSTGGPADLSINSEGGNVGIGTTTPDNKLDVEINVSGGASAFRVLNLANGVGDNVAIELSAARSSFPAKITSIAPGGSDQDLAFTTTDGNVQNESMRIKGSGNVGIGTTAPNTKLQVYGDSGNLLKLQTSNIMSVPGQAIGITFVQSTDAEVARIEAITEANGNIGLRFYTYSGGASERLRISSIGNIGIGLSDPKSKLQVNGGVQIADDSDAASAEKVGTLRYRADSNNSYAEMCMQTGTATYAWIVIKQNIW